MDGKGPGSGVSRPGPQFCCLGDLCFVRVLVALESGESLNHSDPPCLHKPNGNNHTVYFAGLLSSSNDITNKKVLYQALYKCYNHVITMIILELN